MFPRVPYRPPPWKRSDPNATRTFDGEGAENDLLLQIEVVKELTPERRQRVRDMASIRSNKSDLVPYLGRQFGLQRRQIEIILETDEDDMGDDARLRHIVGLDDSGRRLNPADIQASP